MRSRDSDSNYLAKAEQSDFDNFFIRISGLANTWLDHNACITKSRQITELVTRIENEKLLTKTSKSQSFLSSPEFFLGQFIQAIFTLQDEEVAIQTRERLQSQLTKILDTFDAIKHELPITPAVDLHKLSNPARENTSLGNTETATRLGWVARLKRLLNRY